MKGVLEIWSSQGKPITFHKGQGDHPVRRLCLIGKKLIVEMSRCEKIERKRGGGQREFGAAPKAYELQSNIWSPVTYPQKTC